MRVDPARGRAAMGRGIAHEREHGVLRSVMHRLIPTSPGDVN